MAERTVRGYRNWRRGQNAETTYDRLVVQPAYRNATRFHVKHGYWDRENNGARRGARCKPHPKIEATAIHVPEERAYGFETATRHTSASQVPQRATFETDTSARTNTHVFVRQKMAPGPDFSAVNGRNDLSTRVGLGTQQRAHDRRGDPEVCIPRIPGTTVTYHPASRIQLQAKIPEAGRMENLSLCLPLPQQTDGREPDYGSALPAKNEIPLHKKIKNIWGTNQNTPNYALLLPPS